MKKVIALLTLFTLMLSFVACGNSENQNDKSVICENCRGENAADAQFCSACGKSLNGSVDNSSNSSDGDKDEDEPDSKTAQCIQCNAECATGHSYCEAHECEKETCIMQKKSNSKFCVGHSCIYCGYERFGDLAWCSVHNCYWAGCENTNATSGKSKYCSEHKCLICDKGRAYGSDYCTNHDYLD